MEVLPVKVMPFFLYPKPHSFQAFQFNFKRKNKVQFLGCQQEAYRSGGDQTKTPGFPATSAGEAKELTEGLYHVDIPVSIWYFYAEVVDFYETGT